MEESIKKVVAALLANFTKEEMDNRVTNNNMMALTIMIGQALDGQITLGDPASKTEDTTKPKEN
jgi:hypothetical protein